MTVSVAIRRFVYWYIRAFIVQLSGDNPAGKDQLDGTGIIGGKMICRSHLLIAQIVYIINYLSAARNKPPRGFGETSWSPLKLLRGTAIALAAVDLNLPCRSIQSMLQKGSARV